MSPTAWALGISLMWRKFKFLFFFVVILAWVLLFPWLRIQVIVFQAGASHNCGVFITRIIVTQQTLPAFVGARCLGKGLVIIIQIHKHQQVDRIFMAKQELSSGLHYKRQKGEDLRLEGVFFLFHQCSTDNLFTMILSTTDLKIVSQGII